MEVIILTHGVTYSWRGGVGEEDMRLRVKFVQSEWVVDDSIIVLDYMSWIYEALESRMLEPEIMIGLQQLVMTGYGVC